MSSYLTFYLQPAQKKAEKPEEPMLLASYSRSSDVYQAFYEELAIRSPGTKSIRTPKSQSTMFISLSRSTAKKL